MAINEIAAIMAILAALLTLRGIMGQLAEASDPVVRHIGWAFIWLLLAMAGRGFWWDLGPAVHAETWEQVIQTVGGIRFNALFYAPFLMGCWHMLRVLHLLIPEEERIFWPIWRAPFYPKGMCFTRLKRALRNRD